MMIFREVRCEIGNQLVTFWWISE